VSGTHGACVDRVQKAKKSSRKVRFVHSCSQKRSWNVWQAGIMRGDSLEGLSIRDRTRLLMTIVGFRSWSLRQSVGLDLTVAAFENSKF
jgi:hypothetical protein